MRKESSSVFSEENKEITIIDGKPSSKNLLEHFQVSEDSLSRPSSRFILAPPE
jgi:hypothetical protein